MGNSVNSLKGIQSSREHFPTVVVDVNSTNDLIYTEVSTTSELRYSDFSLKSLITAGIDPRSISSSVNVSNKLDDFQNINNLSASLDSNS